MAYGRVDDVGESDFYRKSRRRRLIITISSFLLLVIVVGAVIGIVVSHKNETVGEGTDSPSLPASSKSEPLASNSTIVSKAIKTLCSVTLYPDSCYQSISSIPGAKTVTDPEQLFRFSINVAMTVLQGVADYPSALMNQTDDPREKEALEICSEMIEDSLENLNQSLILMTPRPGEKLLTRFKIDDLKTWLSATITDQETCIDGFEGTSGGMKAKMQLALKNSTEFTSNSLAIASKILGFLDKFTSPLNRRLLGDIDSYPEWVSSEKRKLLQSNGPIMPDAVVAKDGSGQFTTITAALATVPEKSAKPFVIYVKGGKYIERVEVGKKMTNVVMIGDGMDKTVISGSKNFVDGTPTFNTATFVVEGEGFVGKNLCIENTAGAIKHQAVALRVKADKVVFVQCSFVAFQDTLYTHSFRQFYTQCVVTGTVDFIFGDAAVVFQNCNLQPRQPLPNQFVAITAQGKTDPSENTGISIQRCTIRPLGIVTAKTYLGRPWKPFSTTVFMTSTISPVVDPKGWLAWDDNVDTLKTIFYGEYMNVGEGSGTTGRVSWPGYKPAMTAADAQKFAVGSFIQGGEWLPAKGVAFSPQL